MEKLIPMVDFVLEAHEACVSSTFDNYRVKNGIGISLNSFIFQISVSSKQRAEEMYNEFKDEIDEIKW